MTTWIVKKQANGKTEYLSKVEVFGGFCLSYWIDSKYTCSRFASFLRADVVANLIRTHEDVTGVCVEEAE